MKKGISAIGALLAIILLVAGCASSSDAGKDYESAEGGKEKVFVAPVSTPTSDLISSITSSPSSSSEPSGEPETQVKPVELKKKSIEELFDETTNWPDNFSNVPLLMSTAEDSETWFEFVELANSNASVTELEDYLRNWWGKYGWTPEFYAACHNYYLIKASELLENAASETEIDEVYSCFDRCFASTLRGGMQYPDRLDLWCGFIHSANMMGDYADAQQVCMLVLNRLALNGNNWYWTCNEPFYGDDVITRENEFVGIMHDYFCEWIDAEDGLSYAYSVSDVLAQCFPNNAIALNDVALCCIYGGELEKATGYLERAYESNPHDLIVIGNLAYAYVELGELDAAGNYARQMIQSGDEEYVDMGIRLLAEIYGMEKND